MISSDPERKIYDRSLRIYESFNGTVKVEHSSAFYLMAQRYFCHKFKKICNFPCFNAQSFLMPDASFSRRVKVFYTMVEKLRIGGKTSKRLKKHLELSKLVEYFRSCSQKTGISPLRYKAGKSVKWKDILEERISSISEFAGRQCGPQSDEVRLRGAKSNPVTYWPRRSDCRALTFTVALLLEISLRWVDLPGRGQLESQDLDLQTWPKNVNY